jgi:hypothetical protein
MLTLKKRGSWGEEQLGRGGAEEKVLPLSGTNQQPNHPLTLSPPHPLIPVLLVQFVKQ